MTWWLARQHLRGPQVWLLAPLVVLMLLLDAAPVPVPVGLPFLAALLPVVVPAGASAFERTLPVDEGVAECARLVAALAVLAAVLAVSTLGAVLMGRPLFGSTSRQIVSGLAVVGLVAWYGGAGVWVQTRFARPRRLAQGSTVAIDASEHAGAGTAGHAATPRFSADATWRAWWPVLRRTPHWLTLLAAWVGVSAGFSRSTPFMLLFGAQMARVNYGRTALLGVLPISPARRMLIRAGVPMTLLVVAWSAGFALSDLGAARGVGLFTVERYAPNTHAPWRGTVRTLEADGSFNAPDSVREPGAVWRATSAPLSRWQRVHERTSPRVSAPWGETVLADTITVLGRLLYNPYTVRVGNSTRFADWQFERLSAAHFGEPLTYREFTARANHELPMPAVQRWSVQVLCAGVAFAYIVLFFAAYELQLHHRVSRLSTAQQMVTLLPLVVWLAPPLLIVMSGRARGGSLGTPFFEAWALTVSRALPPWLVPLVALLPMVAAFGLLLRQARRSEPSWEEVAVPSWLGVAPRR